MTKTEFIKEVENLKLDFENNKESWENITIKDYLEAIENPTAQICGNR